MSRTVRKRTSSRHRARFLLSKLIWTGHKTVEWRSAHGKSGVRHKDKENLRKIISETVNLV